MDLHSILARLTKHPLFKEWHSQNKSYFLAHAFVMMDEANKDSWQIGFYNSEKERMVTFHVSDTVQKTEEQEVLRGKGEITPLKAEEVKLSVEDALRKAKECLQQNYKAENTIKHFFIIQHVESNTMYNVTFFTQSMKTINIKINAGDGKIIKHSMQSLAEFT